MTRYVHVVAQYLPVLGGAQNYCAYVSEALAVRGHDISVYTSRLSDRGTWQNDLPRLEFINGVSVQRFSALKRGRVTWRVFRWCRNRYSAKPDALLEVGIMLAEGPVALGVLPSLLTGRRGHALVHLFGIYSALAWEAFAAARLAGTPVVITPFIHTTPPIGLDMTWKRRVLELADHVIALTPSEKTHLEREVGLAPDRVSVVSPGIRVSDYPLLEQQEARRKLGLPDSAFVILFIGRKEPHKGIVTLIESFREFRHSWGSACRLVLIGPEVPYSHRPPLQECQDGDIIDLGSVDHDTKVLALNACDCLAFPSVSESFGIVILEAWAAAKPVVVTRLGPTQDTVSDNEDGFLIDVGSVGQLTAALQRLAEDRPKAVAMGESGRRKFLTSYSTDTMADRVQCVYDSLARAR